MIDPNEKLLASLSKKRLSKLSKKKRKKRKNPRLKAKTMLRNKD